MSLLEEKANQIFAAAKGEDKLTVAIDPLTILAIINVISQVIKLYQNCQKTPDEALEHMNGIGWWNRWKLSRLVKAAVKRNHAVSSDEVYNALINHSKGMTVKEVEQLYAEVS